MLKKRAECCYHVGRGQPHALLPDQLLFCRINRVCRWDDWGLALASSVITEMAEDRWRPHYTTRPSINAQGHSKALRRTHKCFRTQRDTRAGTRTHVQRGCRVIHLTEEEFGCRIWDNWPHWERNQTGNSGQGRQCIKDKIMDRIHKSQVNTYARIWVNAHAWSEYVQLCWVWCFVENNKYEGYQLSGSAANI